ncbi:hypothetical protein D3C86_1883160 [compost metagenome]
MRCRLAGVLGATEKLPGRVIVGTAHTGPLQIYVKSLGRSAVVENSEVGFVTCIFNKQLIGLIARISLHRRKHNAACCQIKQVFIL